MTSKEDEEIEETEEDAKAENKKMKTSGKEKKQKSKKIFDFQIEQDDKGINDPDVERNVGLLLLNYLKEDSWLDFPANIPFLLFIMINGIPTTPEEIEE